MFLEDKEVDYLSKNIYKNIYLLKKMKKNLKISLSN